MKGIGGAVLVAVILTAACTWGGAAQSGEEAQRGFPLAKGTMWVYQGTTKWTQPKTGEVEERAVTWQMRITDLFTRGQVIAAVLKGHPADLAHFESGKEQGDYLIVRVGPGAYYLLRHTRGQEALRRLRDENDLLHGLVRGEEIFLDTPLTPGKIFGDAAQITRQDGSYCWTVESTRPAELEGIKGISSSDRRAEYHLVFRTRPDHEEIDFVPGIGITRYTYGHHGTVSETDVKLVEFRRGESSKK